METIRKFEEKEELMEDSKHLREFQKEIKDTQNKMLDELYIEYVEKYNITDRKELETTQKVFNFIKKS